MDESKYKLLLVVTICVSSMMLGVFLLYAHTIMPGLKRVDDASFVKSFQSIDRSIINPFFMLQFFLPMFGFLGLYIYARAQDFGEKNFLLAGFILYVVTFVLTVAINVPLNDGIKKVNPSSSPTAMTEARVVFNESKWVISNLVRTLTNFGATTMAIIALLKH